MSLLKRIKNQFVSLVYANHNQGAAIQRALGSCIDGMGPSGVGLNVGAGGTKLDPRIKNLDLAPGEHIDYVCDATAIPVPDDSFDLIVSQETLEHVADPWKVMAEMHRVLKPGGKIYCQLPFVIGYHPGPTDFWRFSKEGIQQLVEQSGFKTEEIGIPSVAGPDSTASAWNTFRSCHRLLCRRSTSFSKVSSRWCFIRSNGSMV